MSNDRSDPGPETQQVPKSSRLVSVICARSAYLHTGQRPYQAALEGLIHDRTRSRGRTAQNLLTRMGASIHGTSAWQQTITFTVVFQMGYRGFREVGGRWKWQ